MKTLLLPAICWLMLFLITGCNSKPSHEKPSKESTELKKENTSLKKEEVTSDNNSEKAIQKYKKSLLKMKKKYDPNNEVTWYSDRSFSPANNKSHIQIYIGKKEQKKPWLGIAINHFTKKDWLSIERIEVLANNQTYEIEKYDDDEYKSKEESGGKREWVDRVVKGLDMPMIEAIASSKTAKIKFIGKDRVSTKRISWSEKKAIKNVLAAYEALIHM